MKSKKKIDNKENSLKTLFSFPLILLPTASLVGLAMSIYLFYIKIFETKSFCTLSETVSCDAVNASIYSDIFGVPMSTLGIGYFGLILFLTIFKRSISTYKLIFFLTIFVLFPSYYLTGIEIFVLQAYCILCEASKILMIIILIFSFFQTKFKFREAIRMAMPVVIAGIVAAAITFFAQSSGGTKADYSDWVDRLNKKGVVLYKSFKCANCKRMERLIGPAYTKLNKVECHPEGENSKAQLCLEKDIKKTPTLLLEDNGKETKRLEGLQQPDKIGEWAGVPFIKKD